MLTQVSVSIKFYDLDPYEYANCSIFGKTCSQILDWMAAGKFITFSIENCVIFISVIVILRVGLFLNWIKS